MPRLSKAEQARKAAHSARAFKAAATRKANRAAANREKINNVLGDDLIPQPLPPGSYDAVWKEDGLYINGRKCMDPRPQHILPGGKIRIHFDLDGQGRFRSDKVTPTPGYRSAEVDVIYHGGGKGGTCVGVPNDDPNTIAYEGSGGGRGTDHAGSVAAYEAARGGAGSSTASVHGPGGGGGGLVGLGGSGYYDPTRGGSGGGGWSGKPIVVEERDTRLGGRNPNVEHPAHYGGDTTYEVIKVIRAWNLGFDTGNAVKYIARAGKKSKDKHIEDLEKAIFYLQDEIKFLRG